MAGSHILKTTILTMGLLYLGSVLYHQAKSTCCGCEQRYVERPRRFHPKCKSKPTICAQTCSWDPQDVRNKLYQIILTFWEMCLGNSGFVVLLREPSWNRSILFMVVDEAHCIKQWGGDFRKQFTSLETIRSFVPRGVAVLATSATMTPPTLGTVRSTMAINAKISFHLNLGNDRPNIVPIVWSMEGAMLDLTALNFIVRGRDRPLRTIIYPNDKRLTMRACNYLPKLLPTLQVHILDVLHATLIRLHTAEPLDLCYNNCIRTTSLAFLTPLCKDTNITPC